MNCVIRSGYNEYVNYPWDDYPGGYVSHKHRLTRATSSRDSGYYGGIGSNTREEEARQARRRERGDREAMVRDYVRNGRGWSQPNVNGNDNVSVSGGRKLPKTPNGAMNAMAALQGMLGINQTNLTNMLGMNGSVPNINNSISNVSGMMGNSMMSAAVRRLPQVPPLPAVSLPGQQSHLQQQQQQQQSWISKLFHRKSATPQHETNQRLQQQLLYNQQQSNLNQQQILGGQQPGGVVGVPPGGVVGVQPGGVVGVQPVPVQYPGYSGVVTPATLPMSASLSQLTGPLPANLNLVQQMSVPSSSHHHQLHHPGKKPGEGWGGRGAKLPKVPVPLPSLPPNKATYGSHSFEEVEEDLFLDRIVAVGRGSRKLPNPADARPRPGRRLTRQNGIFKRGFSLDSDEYDSHTQVRIFDTGDRSHLYFSILQETFRP